MVAKRVLDLAGAGVLLVLLGPLLLVVATVVGLTSPGPALFRQTRVGRHGRPFTVLKFRTMRAGADDQVHREYVTRLLTDPEPPDGGEAGVYKLARDPRVTPVGVFLRRTSLDELPQLLNVLRGDMSLVGPRPALPWEAALFEPRHRRRFAVKPGVTGLWQVSGRSRLGMREALELDCRYAGEVSLGLDLVILARTVPAVLRGGGAR